MSELHMPRLDLPFPVRISPHAARAEADCRSWARGIGLTETGPQARVTASATWSQLAARVVPTATPQAVVWQARWLAWLGIFDDAAELSHASPARWDQVDRGIRDFVQAGFAAGRAPAQPLVRGFVDLVETIPNNAFRDGGGRFSEHILELLETCRTESSRNSSGVPFSVEEYVVFRRTTGYMPLFYDLHDALTGAALPPDIRDTPEYQQLRTLSIDAIDWINDVYSLPKEISGGQVQNLVLVIAHAERIPVQQALDEAAGRVQVVLEEFCAAEKTFRDSLAGRDLDGDTLARVERNVEGMHDWIVGPADWYPASARYQTAPNYFPPGA